MFGKKKEKVHSIKYVVLENGLPNFVSNSVIEVIINEPDHYIQFKGNGASANLTFNKIIRYETGTKIAVLPKMVSKNKAQAIQTLKIIYSSADGEKEINLCETNYNGTATFNLLVVLLRANIQVDAPKHIDL